MSARSIASLTISFGLVAIPVKLYSATRASGRIAFNLLHAKDGSRLRQQYVCIKENVPVERDEIVKGYEFAKDQYVVFTSEELQALEEAGTHTIEMAEFVPLPAVDPVWFDRTYYLAPDKGGAKPYALLAQALEDSGRCGVGRWASRGKDYLVLLRPQRRALVMHQLHFATEVRDANEIDVEPLELREAELKLARQLIEQQSNEAFEPGSYVDEVRARIEAAIEKKVSGREVTVAEPRAESTGKVIDLMAALRASVERGERARGELDRLGRRQPPQRAVRRARTSRRAARR